MTITRQAVYFSILTQLAASLIFAMIAMVLTNNMVTVLALAAVAFLALFLWEFIRPGAQNKNKFQAALMLLVNLANMTGLYFVTLPADRIPDYALVAVGILLVDFVCIFVITLFSQPFRTPTLEDK